MTRAYTSQKYFKPTKSYSIAPSMSRHENPYDNCFGGKFFSILKTEWINRVKLKTFQQARLLIDEYISFYNNQCIQTKTKLTPIEFRSQFVCLIIRFLSFEALFCTVRTIWGRIYFFYYPFLFYLFAALMASSPFCNSSQASIYLFSASTYWE